MKRKILFIGLLYCFVLFITIAFSVVIGMTEKTETQNIVTRFTLIPFVSTNFDTGIGEYPSIFGTHYGTITPSHNIVADKLYTYPCKGTGGHTKYIKIWNSTFGVSAKWNGYKGDYYNISFNESFTLVKDKTYNYTIRTGSYPQIQHTKSLRTTDGWINCTSFVDTNGKVYNDWIPSIKLWN